MTRDDALRLLGAAPDRLAAAASGVPPALLRTPPAPGEWSAADVLAHLRSCADVWGGHVARMLAEDDPTIRTINPRTYIEGTDYLEWEWAPALAAFTSQRVALLRVLAALPEGDWARAATMTGAGKPLRKTVWSYVEGLARHERPHLKQVERALLAVADGSPKRG